MKFSYMMPLLFTLLDKTSTIMYVELLHMSWMLMIHGLVQLIKWVVKKEIQLMLLKLDTPDSIIWKDQKTLLTSSSEEKNVLTVKLMKLLKEKELVVNLQTHLTLLKQLKIAQLSIFVDVMPYSPVMKRPIGYSLLEMIVILSLNHSEESNNRSNILMTEPLMNSLMLLSQNSSLHYLMPLLQ